MIIRFKEEDGKIAVKSFFHPLIPILLFMGGLFIVLMFVLTGIDSKAFPFLSTGKPLGLPGLIPALFFFAAISAFSYRNVLKADSRQIKLRTGFLFFLETKTRIPVENCEGLCLQPSGKGKMTLFVKMADSHYNTFLGGRDDRITEITEKILAVTGLKMPVICERGESVPFRWKMKIFMMQREADGKTKMEVETEMKQEQEH